MLGILACMANALEIVGRYKEAFGSGDVQTARSLLADDFHFEGPFETFDNPDEYLQSLARLAPIVEGVDVKKVLTDGDDVVTIYDLRTNTVGTSPVAEWATVRPPAFRIARIPSPWCTCE